MRNPASSFSRSPGLYAFKFFMLPHGKQVRRVSFFLDALKALSGGGLRRIGKVSFWLVKKGTDLFSGTTVAYRT